MVGRLRALLAKRDEAVALFQSYPDLVVQLLTILHTAREVDAECARVNLSALTGEHRRLTGVECTARGLTAFSTAVPSIAASVTLPDLENPGATLWPPPQPFNAAQSPCHLMSGSRQIGRHTVPRNNRRRASKPNASGKTTKPRQ